MTEMEYWIWLSVLNVDNIVKIQLLEKYNHPKIIWNLKEKDLIEIVAKENIREILNFKYRENLNKYIDYMKVNNIQVISFYDERYSDKLKNIYSPPVVIYAIGNVELLKQFSIALIGSRICSEYGKNVTKKFAKDLANKGVVVVSGMARGIDKYAHLGCLEVSGKTIAVLGSGVDYIYPYENKMIYENIIKKGGLIISEYIVGTKPDANNFPKRNRIISGLCEGVIVVEAKEKSGSFITVDFALEQGKNVYAVPGNITSITSSGTNRLIQEGAIPIVDINDLKIK